MARSLNKVMLIGNVGSDPEVATTPSRLETREGIARNEPPASWTVRERSRSGRSGTGSPSGESWPTLSSSMSPGGTGSTWRVRSSTRRRRMTRGGRGTGPTSVFGSSSCSDRAAGRIGGPVRRGRSLRRASRNRPRRSPAAASRTTTSPSEGPGASAPALVGNAECGSSGPAAGGAPLFTLAAPPETGFPFRLTRRWTRLCPEMGVHSSPGRPLH